MILLKRNSPTSSHVSAPSKDPIVTSNIPFFFYQVDPSGLNRREFLECSMILSLSSVTSDIVLAFSKSSSRLRGPGRTDYIKLQEFVCFCPFFLEPSDHIAGVFPLVQLTLLSYLINVYSF